MKKQKRNKIKKTFKHTLRGYFPTVTDINIMRGLLKFDKMISDLSIKCKTK